MESTKDGDSQNPNIERNPSSISFSSSSSSTSSFNSLIDINEFENEADIIINGGGDLQSSPTSPQTPVTHEQTGPIEETHSPPTPTQSLVSEIAEQSFVGYDPSRIPSSVFSRKTGGQEWSTASNESLFSIHMGNNSFSLGKSGELFFPYDLNNPQIGFQPPPQPQSQPLPPPPPQKVSDDTSKNSSSLGQTNTPYEEVMTKPPPQIVVVKEEDRVGSLDGDRLSATSTTHLSEESGNSSNSFVFPLLLTTSDAANTKSSEAAPSPKPLPSDKTAATASPPRPPPERAVSLPKKKEEKVDKSKTEQQSHEEAPGGNKTWLSYFSCFSFCPMIKSWQCFCRPNRISNEKETKN